MPSNQARRSEDTPAREYDKGMGEAVANRTINRKILQEDGSTRIETWADVAQRVATGNAMLDPRVRGMKNHRKEEDEPAPYSAEFSAMHHHLRQASLLMSGRHLQHGDETQINRNMEVFTNCSTSTMSFLEFYLLLNGSGVGRCYDDVMMQIDWRLMPTVVCVINGTHTDVQSGEITAMDARSARHLYAHKTIHEYQVPDSREGWAQGIEKVETMTFAGCYRNDVLILEFSDVRCRNSPINGMQNRPASGPGPLIDAINKVAKLRDAGMEPWRATMFADHYFAECVLVGGARRAARMATKFWKDKSIFGFIELKRGGFLWSSNNSVMVDMEFWDSVKRVASLLETAGFEIINKEAFHKMIGRGLLTDSEVHAWKVFHAACEASYYDGTGEPGFITVERLVWNGKGSENLLDGDFAESKKYQLSPEAKQLSRVLAQAWNTMKYKVITNPCGEIVLNLLGAYCVIADVVPYHAQNDDDAEDAFRTATRALIRTNLMDSMYGKEVARTNRIGVGMTGIHEYAWARFQYGWKDLVDEAKSMDFWLMLSRFKRAVQDEAAVYSKIIGVVTPHTDTTMKPAGCATPDTVVNTVYGGKTLEDIFKDNGYNIDQLKELEDGTWLPVTSETIVFDESNECKQVTRLYVNGEKPVFELEFEDGFIVKLTGNHKLKTVSGWKRVDELTTDDEIISF